MEEKQFRQIIDAEINALVEKYKDDEFIQKQDTNQKKSYAFLIWFLDFYAKKLNYRDYITEGDNDSSCDIVFDYNDHLNNRIFYILQSKWIQKYNEKTSSSEIKIALSDFDSILKSEKKNINPKLSAKIRELDAHLRNNGEVRFLFFTLTRYEGGADENIAAFINKNPKIKFEVIDINRIKSDYIDRQYKGISPLNPLNTYLNPEETLINLPIVSAQDNGHTRIEKPFDAYILLLRPKAIWDLFDKYGFALFFKNVRNPLWESQFNSDIEKTAAENPAYFWYYNNGITAITKFLPKIGTHAENISLDGGLQVINGAQTVYAIYRAYENASQTEKKQMDNEMLITLRLLKSGGKDFDLNVTRYTNSQNPVEDRDFCANDDIQIALQKASFQTNTWYEKRRGEFRKVPEGVEVVTNYTFAIAYLAYHLQKPATANIVSGKDSKNRLFRSEEVSKDGLYETIFNENTRLEDMRAAWYLYVFYRKNDKIFKPNYVLPNIALSKSVLTKYFKAKFDCNENEISQKIIKHFERKEEEVFYKIFTFIHNFLIKQMPFYEKPNVFAFFGAETNAYNQMRERFEAITLSAEDIDKL